MSNTFARLLGGVWRVVWCCCAALPGLAQMPAPGGEGAAAVDGEAAGEPAAEPAIQPRALMTDAEAEAMFKQAFGEELREVESSRDNTDDVEFAQTLLRGARGMVE